MFASREGRNQKKILGSRFRGLPLNFVLFFIHLQAILTAMYLFGGGLNP